VAWGGTLPAVGDSLSFGQFGTQATNVVLQQATPVLADGIGVVWTLPNVNAPAGLPAAIVPFTLLNNIVLWVNTSTASTQAAGDSTATWDLSEGSNSYVLNNNTIEIMAGSAMIGDSSASPGAAAGNGIQGSGRINLFSTAQLTLWGSAGGGQIVDFLSNGAKLTLETPQQFAGTIAGFQSGDSVDIVGIAPPGSAPLGQLGTTVTVTPTANVQIIGLYQQALDRDPDPLSVNYWQQQLNAGMSLNAILNILAYSAEATTKLTALFEDVKGGPIAATELWQITNLESQLAAGSSLPTVEATLVGQAQSCLPNWPQYCRATPTEWMPFFRKPVSSMIQAWIGSSRVIDGSTRSRTRVSTA